MDLGEIDIDIQQLPIPDWNLPCPRCRYCLNGLPEHRCPECGLEFDMADVVRPWHKLREPRFRGDELPFPDFGLNCPSCKTPLAGAAARACPACGAAFDPRSFMLHPHQDWFCLYSHPGRPSALPQIQALLISEFVPHRAEDDRSTSDVVLGSPPLAGRILVSSEFFFEYCWLMRRAALDADHTRRESGRARWTCPSCGRRVPANFDVCWNCEALRPES